MSVHILYIVGDGFKSFAHNHGVMTISEIEAMANMAYVGSIPNRVYLVGQGVSAKRLRSLRQKIKSNMLEKHFDIKNGYAIAHEENQKSVHKRKTENVMISVPVPSDTDLYQSNMILDDACADMSDHTTGQHIQGIILIEAARQMMLSVTEHYILQPEQRGKSYFVINQINSSFHQFVFPLEIILQYKIVELQRKQKGSIKSKAIITFIQNKISVAEIEIVFSVYDEEFISQKEAVLAANLVEQRQMANSACYTNVQGFEECAANKKVAFG